MTELCPRVSRARPASRSCGETGVVEAEAAAQNRALRAAVGGLDLASSSHPQPSDMPVLLEGVTCQLRPCIGKTATVIHLNNRAQIAPERRKPEKVCCFQGQRDSQHWCFQGQFAAFMVMPDEALAQGSLRGEVREGRGGAMRGPVHVVWRGEGSSTAERLRWEKSSAFLYPVNVKSSLLGRRRSFF